MINLRSVLGPILLAGLVLAMQALFTDRVFSLSFVAGVFVGGGVLLFMGICHTGQDLHRSLRLAFWTGGDRTDQDVRISQRVFLLGAFAAIGFGVGGYFLGEMAVLYNMADPSLIGEGMALALSSVVFGLFLAGCLTVFRVQAAAGAQSHQFTPAEMVVMIALLCLVSVLLYANAKRFFGHQWPF